MTDGPARSDAQDGTSENSDAIADGDASLMDGLARSDTQDGARSDAPDGNAESGAADVVVDPCHTGVNRPVQAADEFIAHLNGSKAYPPNGSDRTADAFLVIRPDDGNGDGFPDVEFAVTAFFSDPVDIMARAQFYRGNLCEPQYGPFFSSPFTVGPDIMGTLPAVGTAGNYYDVLGRGEMYVSIITNDYPGGEIGGWLSKQ